MLSVLNRFKKFFTRRLLVKFAIKRTSKIPPHLACVASLPCETLMSAKQAVNDKLHGHVVTYLRFVDVDDNKIKKGLLLSLKVKIFIAVNIWQIYKQEHDCFVHFITGCAVAPALC